MSRARELFIQAMQQGINLRLQAAGFYKQLAKQKSYDTEDAIVVQLVETARMNGDEALYRVINRVERDEVTRILAGRFTSACDQYQAGKQALERAIERRGDHADR